jgi:hypothetical protein
MDWRILCTKMARWGAKRNMASEVKFSWPSAVNTRFSCLCTLDPDYSFVPHWQSPVITGLAAEDRCHLNGLAMADGAPRYATALHSRRGLGARRLVEMCAEDERPGMVQLGWCRRVATQGLSRRVSGTR